jgi:hypothetical protein
LCQFKISTIGYGYLDLTVSKICPSVWNCRIYFRVYIHMGPNSDVAVNYMCRNRRYVDGLKNLSQSVCGENSSEFTCSVKDRELIE